MPVNPRTAHLVYGPIAAGKSTFARRLATQTNSVRFTIDEWMHVMFGDDVPDTMDMAWVMPRVARCQSQIWSLAQQIMATGTDVVMDTGLFRRTDRDAFITRVRQAGHNPVLHFVDADLEIRKERLARRNAEKGETYFFEISSVMFEIMETYFERPGGYELANAGLEENLHI